MLPAIQIDLRSLDLRKMYRNQSSESCRNAHIGQRKLLLSEMNFLCSATQTNSALTILYVGAAPGHHLVILSKLFQKCKFILYDGAPFAKELHDDPTRFELHNEYFTNETCQKYKDIENLIFISDIRLSAPDKNVFEDQVSRDMEVQRDWVRLLRPKLSLLKFRLPYFLKHGDTYRYLQGTLYYGIWPKRSSGESRLLVTREDLDKPEVDYDFQAYEETMAYHNDIRRPHQFTDYVRKDRPQFKPYVTPSHRLGHDRYSPTGYCACYDCIAELQVFQDYIDTCASHMTLDDVIMMSKAMYYP